MNRYVTHRVLPRPFLYFSTVSHIRMEKDCGVFFRIQPVHLLDKERKVIGSLECIGYIAKIFSFFIESPSLL